MKKSVLPAPCHSSGAALLIVLAMLGLVSSMIMHVWFITSLQYDIMIQRKLWYEKFYTTEMVLNVALVNLSKQFDQLLRHVHSSKKSISIDYSHLLKSSKNDGVSKQAHVLIQAHAMHKDVLLIKAQLLDDKICSCLLACILKKVEMQQHQGKETHCVTSHFTIGSGM